VHTDHLNTPRKISRTSDNQLEWRWDADPFGTAAANQNPQGLGTFTYNLRFPGQYYMAETGLNQNVHRDYDPSVGRFIESDPMGLKGGGPQYLCLRDKSPDDAGGFKGLWVYYGFWCGPDWTGGRREEYMPSHDSLYRQPRRLRHCLHGSR
jgi:RHS repeat-associated protein